VKADLVELGESHPRRLITNCGTQGYTIVSFVEGREWKAKPACSLSPKDCLLSFVHLTNQTSSQEWHIPVSQYLF
jgi:hypothetical protein